jgi:hypothetical protein
MQGKQESRTMCLYRKTRCYQQLKLTQYVSALDEQSSEAERDGLQGAMAGHLGYHKHNCLFFVSAYATGMS